MNPDDFADLDELHTKVRLQLIGEKVISYLNEDDINPQDGAAVLGALFCSLMVQSCERKKDLIAIIESLKETAMAAWEQSNERP